MSGLVLLTLAGCGRLDVALTVHRNDTVTGVFTLAMNKQLVALSGKSADQLFDPATVFPGTTMAKVEPFDDGTNIGSTYTTTAVPLDNFSKGVDKQGAIIIEHTRGQYTFSGTLPTSTAGESTETQQALSTATWKVSVTFPGPVLTSNGTVQGRTVTWTGNLGSERPMEATASDFPLTPMMTAIYGGCLLALVVIVVCLVILVRRRRAHARAWYAPPAPVYSGDTRFTGPAAFVPQAPSAPTAHPGTGTDGRGTYGWGAPPTPGAPYQEAPPQGWNGPPPGTSQPNQDQPPRTW